MCVGLLVISYHCACARGSMYLCRSTCPVCVERVSMCERSLQLAPVSSESVRVRAGYETRRMCAHLLQLNDRQISKKAIAYSSVAHSGPR